MRTSATLLYDVGLASIVITTAHAAPQAVESGSNISFGTVIATFAAPAGTNGSSAAIRVLVIFTLQLLLIVNIFLLTFLFS